MGRAPVRITVDTNVLVRAVVNDDAAQSECARRALAAASVIVVPTPVLCELAWVLRSVYRRPVAEIAETIRALARVDAVRVDRVAVDEGLACLDAGGDFADAIIADAGRRAGGDIFVSFDQRAVAILLSRGWRAEVPEAVAPEPH